MELHTIIFVSLVLIAVKIAITCQPFCFHKLQSLNIATTYATWEEIDLKVNSLSTDQNLTLVIKKYRLVPTK